MHAIPAILLALISADHLTSDRSFRFAEMAAITLAENPPGTKGYSVTGKADYRVDAATKLFDSYARYTRVPSFSFYPRCHCKRIYDSYRTWQTHISTQDMADKERPPARPREELTVSEQEDFKTICFKLATAPDVFTRQKAMQTLFATADRGDVAKLTTLAKHPGIDRGLILLTLGRIGDEGSIPLLAKELNGPAWEEAIAALENIDGAAALAALEKAGAKLRELKRKELVYETIDRMKGRR